ncbi:hypothetical protein EON65_08145 [archaeon]|nr:MAG: hypothetical protein EON65_08145 [archaeon]
MMMIFYPVVLLLLAVFKVGAEAEDDAYFNRAFHSFNFLISLQKHFSKDIMKLVIKNNSDYQRRQPFPYMYIDGLFPQDVLVAAEKEIPDSRKLKGGCIPGAQCFMDATQYSNLAITNEDYMGPATSALFTFMRSTIFIRFLEQLTGRFPIRHSYRSLILHQNVYI